MNQSQIFISYTSDNRPFARKLYNDLLSAGYWVWMDKMNLEAAHKWEPQIHVNLMKSKTLIALISSKSIKSDWVKHEGSMALALDQKIIPVKIEPGKLAGKLPIWAADIELLDLIEGSADYEDKFQELMYQLGQPLPIRQYIEHVLIQKKYDPELLLDEVGLALVERHYHDLHLSKDKKELLDKLITETRSKMETAWMRYERLKREKERVQQQNTDLLEQLQAAKWDNLFQNSFIALLYVISIAFACSLIVIAIRFW